MANCENCIHKYVCKNYPVDSLPPIVRQSIFKKLDKECEEFINNADVNLVVHAHWIEENDGTVQICSNCGEEHEWQEYRATYCEDCGARMDGEINV